MSSKSCPRGKVVNPKTGRCVNKNSSVFKRQEVKTKLIKSVSIEIKPDVDNLKKLSRSDLNMLSAWWKKVNTPWYGAFELNNLMVVPNYSKSTLICMYDYPKTLRYEDDINVTNDMIVDPDNTGFMPVFVKDNKIVSIDKENPNGGKPSTVKGRLINTKTINRPVAPVAPVAPVSPLGPVGPLGPVSPLGPLGPVGPVSPLGPVGPVGPVGPTHVNKLVRCGENKYINPRTKRCVKFQNKDIQRLIYELGTKYNKYNLTKPAPVPKVTINNPKNVDDKDIKVLVPPNPKETVKLIYCGKGKVINPTTGRCILLSGPVGKRLTSVPYIIINPPKKSPSTPTFIPAGPKPQKGPYQQVPFPKTKSEKIKTGLDTDGDNYVSIKEYLDVAQSLGPKEKKNVGNFSFYNQRDLGILFVLTLIKKLKGPIHKIGCIPLYHLCIYKKNSGTFYTMSNIKDELTSGLICPSAPTNSKFFDGSGTNTYASIVILNAPENYSSTNKQMSILVPPNLRDLIHKCENDNKYMVVCDLTLLSSENVKESSHANVLIFDTRRKTIERFDPHGGNEYSDVKLAYDPDSQIGYGRKDFQYKKSKFGLKSNSLYNQVVIDNTLKNEFKNILSDYTYYGTNKTTPYLGPQIKADEYDGLCVTWACMYMILRLLNPDMEPAQVTMKMIDGTPKELKNRILRFQKFIIRVLSKESRRSKYII